MKADLVRSQFNALQEPSDEIVINAAQPPREIAESIANRLKARERSPGAGSLRSY